jgi:hypothetical protein
MGCVHVSWVCIGYLRVGCGGVGGRVDALCCWGWIPRFALNYIELVGVCSLDVDFTCFTSVAGSARSWGRLDVGRSAGGNCVVCV